EKIFYLCASKLWIALMGLSKDKYYFASDFHFGIPDDKASLERERLIIKWLDDIKTDAKEIYILGDVFDFWYEYSKVVPKGFIRILGKMIEVIESGTPIHLFKGNHDLWTFGYLENEIGLICHSKPETIILNGKKIHLAHGDGLGPDDVVYKILLRFFRGPVNQVLFRWIHPDLGVRIGLMFSKKHRYIKRHQSGKDDNIVIENELLYKYSSSYLKKDDSIDYFIFGHRHIPINTTIDNSRLIILGDWMIHNTYGVLDNNGNFQLKKYK
ncbi:MAG: UDP-2,3-diacylglucosamine diphosphatase, partial [Bacteroidales bacterium]|nr:UDP-2,3-diacylglucosamine diphosphatase [Bacteroidales bacterium]